jgi:PAS domain S-box-containing protein
MTAEQTKTLGWKSVLHPDDLDHWMEAWKNAIQAGEAYEMELRFKRASDSDYRWHLGRAVPVRDARDRIVRWFGTWTDINDHRLAEGALRTSEQLFRGAFDAGQTGIALIGADGKTYVDVNDALCEMLGYSKEELLRLDWMQVTHPDDRSQMVERVESFLESGEDVDYADKRYVRKDGEIISVEISDSLIRGQDGSPMYCVTHVTDVTEQEKASEEKEKLQERLRQAQKMEAVGQLAGGVAHDFNNILAVVLNYAEFVAETLDEEHEGHADLDQIIKAGERGAELVHQLLAFSRQEVIQPSVIDLNEVVTGMAVLLSRSVGEDIDLDIETPSGLSLTKADHGQIEQILLNLVVNARDSMPDGGQIRIVTENVDLAAGERVDLTAGAYVCLTVTDTGTGIDPETLEHIFEPFFTTKERGEGTGLGLATVYGIVKQAYGGIFVTSEIGVMTSFAVYLPVTTEKVTTSVEKPSVQMVDEATILVVEDEDPVRDLIGRILRRRGFEVIDVASGAEALEICSSFPTEIDLLLTDVVMPQMSGPALRDLVLPLRPDIRVLFMSGYTDELIAKRGVLDVGDALINKPFNSEQLLTRVREALHSKVAPALAS